MYLLSYLYCYIILPISRSQLPVCSQVAGVVLVVVQHVHGTLGVVVLGQDAAGAEFHHPRRAHVINVLVHLAVAGGDAPIGAVLLRILGRELLVAPELHRVDGVGGRRTAAAAAQLLGEERIGRLGVREWFQILLVLGWGGIWAEVEDIFGEGHKGMLAMLCEKRRNGAAEQSCLLTDTVVTDLAI